MRRRSLLAAAVCVSITLVSTPVARGESGRCLRAEVPLPMLFPDGSEQPAGTLALCVADYSPVASYHKVAVNGHPVGFLFSQRRIPEQQKISDPVVIFGKTREGKLRLMGYLWPSGNKVTSYMLQGEPWDADAQTRIPAKETIFPPAGTDSDAPKP